MPFVKVTNNEVKLIGENFQTLRTIATNAASADRHAKDPRSVIVHTDGRVVLYDDDARTVRTITSGGSSSVFSGDDIIIKKSNGKTEVWTQSGQLLRTMDSNGINIKKLLVNYETK